jgi:hypothetical protein
MAGYWIKLYTEILDDYKYFKLPDVSKLLMYELFLLAKKVDQGGNLPDLDEMSFSLRRSKDDILAAIRPLIEVGIISEDEDCAYVTHFEDRQSANGNAERSRHKREKEHKEAATHTEPDCKDDDTNVTRDLQNSDTKRVGEKRREEKRENVSLSLPPQIQTYVDNGGKFQSGKLTDGISKKDHAIEFILSKVGNDPRSLELWGKVVKGYCAQWSSHSYTVMVNEYYLENRIPGERAAPAPQKPKHFDSTSLLHGV